ncbi:MAG: exo-alpha-sialidase, partial [Planctomycetota bacterium]
MTVRAWVGTRKGLFGIRRKADGIWGVEAAHFLGVPVTAVLAEPGGQRLHAALDHGHFGTKMQLSTDGGKSFAEGHCPAYPEKPEGVVDLDPMRGKELAWKLKLLWCLENGRVPGRLWAGTIPGGLFRSDNSGESWELCRPLWDHPDRKKWFGGGADQAGLHSIVVDPRDPEHVVCGVSCGGVWRTRDGGATWEQTAHGMDADYLPSEQRGNPDNQDPHCIVSCEADPEIYWAQHHCGIFRSTDGAKSWHEIKEAGPSTFGFPVAVHPKDPDTAWFLPGVKDEERIPVDGQVVMTR